MLFPTTISEVDTPSLLPYGSWRWVRLCNIAEVIGWPHKESASGMLFLEQMKYLRVANVYADGILTDDVHKIGVTEEETS